MKKGTEKTRKNTFYKTNPKGGISLIVLVITIIVVIILAAAVIISLQNNNPMVEANEARIKSDVANMQAIFTNTVGKIMAENQDVVTIVGGQLYTTPTGNKKTEGEATYQILGTDGTPVVEGKIKFSAGEKLGTTYYTGKELPLYSSETKWYVDNQGLLSVEVGGVTYGEGEKVEEEGEEIAASDNPMLQSWDSNASTDFHAPEYKSKITKIKFATNVKVPNSKIESWDVSKDKDGSVMAWVQSDENEGYIITIAGKEKILANSNSRWLFSNFNNLKEIENLPILDTSNVTLMAYMFQNCSSITNLDLSNFSTKNATSIACIFTGCSRLQTLDLGNFDTSKVTNMNSMFWGCSSLTSIDLSSFDTSNVETMNGTFYDCEKLTNLDLGNFNTGKVTNMLEMFSGCSNLQTLDLSSFDTSKVINMQSMFNGCSNLTTTLNINGNQVTMYSNMFKNCSSIGSAKVIVNYTAENTSLVDSMIATKSTTSNVVKGVQI